MVSLRINAPSCPSVPVYHDRPFQANLTGQSDNPQGAMAILKKTIAELHMP